MAEVLLQHGAVKDRPRKDGHTPHSLAVKHERHDVAELLLKDEL